MKKIPTGTTGQYMTHPCVVLNISHPDHPDWQLLKFPNVNTLPVIGWAPDSEDNSWGIESIPGATYLWFLSTDNLFNERWVPDSRAMEGYHCVVCNNYNKWAEANLMQDRHICYSCKSTYAWRYEGQFLDQ